MLYERLLASLMGSSCVDEIRKYEAVLMPRYPSELLGWYERTARDMASVTGNREHYRELVRLLHSMAAYPGGRERARVLADEWRGMYRRRSAMMDELRRGSV